MCEILFRGKRVDNGEWIEGSLISGAFTTLGRDIKYILCPDKADYDCFEDFSEENGIFEVITETVGQYTSFTDKNGTKIFEGDICRKFKSGDCVSVAWHGTMAGYVWSKRKENNRYIFDFGDLFRVSDKYEVIGNIHDNPELLDGAGNR